MSFTSDIKNELQALPKDKDEKKDFLRRMFILSGSIIDPQKEYHMEILCDTEELANFVSDLLNEFGVLAKVLETKYKFATYVKEADGIAQFLTLIGAYNSLFKFEDAKITHEMNNKINRMVNCETANLSKTVNAAVRQIEAIMKIKNANEFESLPESLKEIAILRLDNPDADLTELGKMLSTPLGKSGVNHRLKKLEEIASEIKD